jgi:glycosyltransferase involved in cell wall biosynthesis
MYNVKDTRYPSALYTFNGLDFRFNNFQATVPASIAYRMNRVGDPKAYIVENKVTPYNPDSWKKERRIIWNCNYAPANGFGNAMEMITKELILQGVNLLNPGSISNQPWIGAEYTDPIVQQALNKNIEPDCLEIQYCQPPALRLGIVQRIWTYAMFETTHIPKNWVEILNQLERVLVPASWLVDSWKEQGVTTPISVFHHGIDPSKYYYVERPELDTFTFLHMGQLSDRKGTDLVTRAFLEEFPTETNVKLVCKTSSPLIMGVPLDNPRIEVIHAIYSHAQMMDLFRKSDVFVFPTRGEGFGFPPIETMASGMPSIVTGWSGPADYVDKEDTMILDYKMVRSKSFDFIYKGHYRDDENSGYWAEPNYEQLRHYMRWSYNNRAKVREMGKHAAERMARDWNWKKKVSELIKFFDEVL